MALEGYVEYMRREYCKDISCPIQVLLDRQAEGSPGYEEIRNICKTNCIHSTYEFHHWLIEKGYLIVRPQPTA
jgi:hypothetical protein